MESTIIFVLVFTFILSSIFKTAFWLKIPIGCFLLILGALSHDIYQTTGLIIFVVVFALPYILSGNNLINLPLKKAIVKRLNKVVDFNFKQNSYSMNVEDNGFDVTTNNININTIKIKDNFFVKIGIYIEIILDFTVKRSLYISVIFFMSGALLNELSFGFNDALEGALNITNKEADYLSLFLFLFFIVLDVYLANSKTDITKTMHRVENYNIEKRRSELQEKAEAEQKELIQEYEAKNDKIRNTTLRTEQERTKQKEIDSNLRIEKLRTERPEKERKLSAILDKLDDL